MSNDSQLELVMYNSPIGAFKRVGPPTYAELQERRQFYHAFERSLNRFKLTIFGR